MTKKSTKKIHAIFFLAKNTAKLLLTHLFNKTLQFKKNSWLIMQHDKFLLAYVVKS